MLYNAVTVKKSKGWKNLLFTVNAGSYILDDMQHIFGQDKQDQDVKRACDNSQPLQTVLSVKAEHLVNFRI